MPSATKFVPLAGRDYAARRNYDLGPSQRLNVSMLSPWVRHRLLSEQEVVNTVLATHDLRTAEKFIQEVCWRTYWKGWLEMRPGVWTAYQQSVRETLGRLETDRRLARRVEDACAGRTGIECFDAWVDELTTSGYLHNHARMWFASIWIFTLRLPWELGADLFLRHLIDGDPASNTLSWRWVAGLQTVGKIYLARSDNIAKYTNNRFPSTPGLCHDSAPIEAPAAPSPRVLNLPKLPEIVRRTGLLLTEDDLAVETLPLPKGAIAAAAATSCVEDLSPLAVGDVRRAFTNGALVGTLRRVGGLFGAECRDLGHAAPVDTVVTWAIENQLEQVAAPYAPVGPAAQWLYEARNGLERHGIETVLMVRTWDRLFWPHAVKGFFGLKKRIPQLLRALEHESL